jgi:hypothetical protein
MTHASCKITPEDPRQRRLAQTPSGEKCARAQVFKSRGRLRDPGDQFSATVEGSGR